MNLGSYHREVAVVCPNPRRICVEVEPNTTPEMLYFSSEQTDLRLWEDDDCELTASSPPYFCGSPPTRVDNPLIHDPRFLQQNSYDIPTTTPAFFPATSLKTSVKDRRRGLFRSKKSSDSLGMIPAAVRIEGFDYLDHSSNNRGCRISGFA